MARTMPAANKEKLNGMGAYIYNFNLAEDWDGGNHKNAVTYGTEISTNPNLTRDREDFSESDDLRRLKEGTVTVRFRGGEA